MKSAKILLIALFSTAFLITTRAVRADVAPPSRPSGSNVVPGEVTMVQMLSERVIIDLRPPWSDGSDADVTAKFLMRNQGAADEHLSVGFPLNSIENMPDMQGTYPKIKDLQININGSTVDYQVTSEDRWLKNSNEKTKAVDWAVFDVDFPAGNDVVIDLTYKQPPTYDAPTTQYDYTLISGAGWYGQIGEGDILFRLPYTISWGENFWTYEDENIWDGLDTETVVENEVRWHFEDFEPQNFIDDNWTVHVIRPKDWQRVLSARQAVTNNQYDARLWKELGDAYSNAATKLGGKTYDSSYNAILAYQQSVTLKPDWAEAHALLADEYYKAYSDSEFYATESNPPDESLRRGALQELSVALALEPDNETARALKELLEILWPQSTLPAPTPFQTQNPRPLESSSPTALSITITAVRSKPEKDVEHTPTPRGKTTNTAIAATNAVVPTLTPTTVVKETGNQSPLSIAITGMVATFIAGAVVATVWFKLTKK